MTVPVIPDHANARQLGVALLEAAEELAKLRSLPEDKRTDETANEALRLRYFVEEVDPEHKARAAAERAIYIPESNGPKGGFDAPVERTRSLGEIVSEHESVRNGGTNFSTGSVQIQLSRALLSETDSGGLKPTLFIPTQQPRMIDTLTRRLFVRDLLMQSNVTVPSVPFMQEKTPATNEDQAGMTAEAAPKTEVQLDFEQKDAPIRKLSAWIPLTTEIIEDAPLLRTFVDERLLWMLKLREEKQFLTGSGTGANITGILTTVGIQTQDAVIADIPATVAAALAKIENVDGQGDGVAMNPIDYWQAVASRHSATFDNGYGGNAPAGVSSITWGLPVVRSRTLASGRSIVADWREGGMVLDRSEATIEVGMQHSDYFITNKVAVRAEERVGLMILRPAFFVDTTIDFTA